MTTTAPDRAAPAPHRPRWKDPREWATELTIVTLGVLIALTLDGVAGWLHDRALVREATANIRNELRDNREEMQHHLKNVASSGAQLQQALVYIAERQSKKPPTITSLQLGYNIVRLDASSRATAAATGALALMPYAEVKRFAGVYELQDQFLHVQERLLETWVPVLDLTHVGFETATPDELQRWRERILTVMSYLQVESSLGQSLTTAYDSVLQQ